MSLESIYVLAQTVQAAITTLGIIAAGVWTLYNFGLTRYSAPQIEISLSIKKFEKIKERVIALLCIEVKNTGRTRIHKRYAVLGLHPIFVQSNWPELTKINLPLVYQQEDTHEILVTHTFLDPGEKYHEEIGIVLTKCDFVQVGIVFAGVKRTQAWESNWIFGLPHEEVAG